MKMILTLLFLAVPAVADPMLIDDFSDGTETRWRYVSDRVMGGVSDGGASIGSEDGASFAQLRGTVSTANNGGFIQLRQELQTRLPADATGIALRVRGNGATYYVHIRPGAARRPWQFYQAAFETTPDWQEITLPWSAFKPQGGLDAAFAPADLRSIGIVAYGADYDASLDVDWIATAPLQ
ncbi:CIA30 family protein [Yoonia algicola]|uniref:CIA30 family protein n=1 Tax=Yoonia algicola TaxID=3137368 RepID=A0AAN0M6L7_9RHOB